MAQLNAAVARRLGETDGSLKARRERPCGEKPSPSPNGGKVISRSYFAFASPPRLLAGRFEKNVAGFLLRRVAPSRWTLGGYADEHYVKPDPEPHGRVLRSRRRGPRVSRFSARARSAWGSSRSPRTSAAGLFVKLVSFETRTMTTTTTTTTTT